MWSFPPNYRLPRDASSQSESQGSMLIWNTDSLQRMFWFPLSTSRAQIWNSHKTKKSSCFRWLWLLSYTVFSFTVMKNQNSWNQKPKTNKVQDQVNCTHRAIWAAVGESSVHAHCCFSVSIVLYCETIKLNPEERNWTYYGKDGNLSRKSEPPSHNLVYKDAWVRCPNNKPVWPFNMSKFLLFTDKYLNQDKKRVKKWKWTQRKHSKIK